MSLSHRPTSPVCDLVSYEYLAMKPRILHFLSIPSGCDLPSNQLARGSHRVRAQYAQKSKASHRIILRVPRNETKDEYQSISHPSYCSTFRLRSYPPFAFAKVRISVAPTSETKCARSFFGVRCNAHAYYLCSNLAKTPVQRRI